MNRNFTICLEDMIHNIELAEEYIRGMSINELCNDKKTIYAVIRTIEIIGEAAKNVPKNIQNQYDFPWSEIINNRNKLIHRYFHVENKKIISVIETYSKNIKPKLNIMLYNLYHKNNFYNTKN